jgi:hypothetical protein
MYAFSPISFTTPYQINPNERSLIRVV